VVAVEFTDVQITPSQPSATACSNTRSKACSSSTCSAVASRSRGEMVSASASAARRSR